MFIQKRDIGEEGVKFFPVVFHSVSEFGKSISGELFANFQPISNEYSELRNYLLLATICAFQFKNSTNLKYLNTLLKLNDIICSQITSIDNSIDASLFNIVISHELNFITTLIQKKC